MTVLSLHFNGRKIKDYALMRGQNLTIGRNADNDIVLDSLSVSGYHARVESVATSFVVRDMDSTNGLFVNKKRTKMHTLQHNDIVRVGKHDFVFDKLVFDRDARIDQSQKQADDSMEFDENTFFLDTKEHKELIQKVTNAGPVIEEPEPQTSWFSGLMAKILGRKKE